MVTCACNHDYNGIFSAICFCFFAYQIGENIIFIKDMHTLLLTPGGPFHKRC